MIYFSIRYVDFLGNRWTRGVYAENFVEAWRMAARLEAEREVDHVVSVVLEDEYIYSTR